MKKTKVRRSKTKRGSKTRKTLRTKKTTKTAKATKVGKPIGKVTHFYGGIGVAIVKFSKGIGLNKAVRFRGATTNFVQKIAEMQYNHQPITKAPKGKQVGIKVRDRVREGDEVFEEV
ncbi:MAG: hypothetical protein M1361_00285 [Patescibacteria group bacterium]|nr:hypothetical protein [Patescibacteria group bacterium]MCL5224053.1 hypothetical protein [Patescibacteria group bacterium]